MKKKIFFKKIIKIFFIIFLIFSLLNSCSPLASHAVGIQEISDVYNFTKFLPFDDIVNGSIIDTANTIFQEIGLKLVSSDSLIVDINNYNSGASSSLSVHPFYTFTAKERYNCSYNGSSRFDGYAIIEVQTSISTDKNFTYPNSSISGLIPVTMDMYSSLSHNQIPVVGTIFYTLTIVDNTAQTSTTTHFCFIPDRMPYLNVASSATNLSLYLEYNYNTGKWYNLDNLPTLNGVSTTCSSRITFNVTSTNSIVVSSGFDIANITPQDIILGNFSLAYRYCLTSVLTNDTSFVSMYQQKLNDNSSSYGSNFEPVLKKVGIDARQTITVNNVNNYVDRGITYNSTTNQYGLNTYNYDNYFYEHDIPEVKIVYDDLFNNQPAPLQPFSDTIRYNYNDLVAIPLSSDYLPSEWLDSYGSLDTHPNINIDDFLSVPTETFDVNLIHDMGVVTSSGMDLLDVFGLASPFLALALLGVLFKFFD